MTRWWSPIAGSVYRRTSLPFRIAFKMAAHARSPRPFRRLVEGDEDAFLARHTREYYVELWTYGYHRMYDLLCRLDPTLDRSRLRVLSIGPRTEIELYYLWLIFGFAWGNIAGVDLVSASSKIEFGDMGKFRSS